MSVLYGNFGGDFSSFSIEHPLDPGGQSTKTPLKYSFVKWRTKITIQLRGNLHHCGFCLSSNSTYLYILSQPRKEDIRTGAQCFVFLVFVYGSFSSQMRKCISQNNTSVLLSKFNNQLLKCAQTEKAVAACNIKHAQYKLNNM